MILKNGNPTKRVSRSTVYSKEIPDVLDGLTSLQRQILSKVQKITSDNKCKKTERIIIDFEGEHLLCDMYPRSTFGISSKIYDYILNMVQKWNSTPLLEGNGNFGYVSHAYGDFADPRYNELKLSAYAKMLFNTNNINLADQGFTTFFTCLPNILISGTEGTVCNIPPHNLGEVIDAVVALIKTPDLQENEIFNYIKGPDYADGGIIINKSELPQIYKSGVGNIHMRGKVNIEKDEDNSPHLIITELPFTLIPKFKCIGHEYHIDNLEEVLLDEFTLWYDILDIKNSSTHKKIHIDISLKKGCSAKKYREGLYLLSNVEGNYEYRAILMSDGIPKLMSLYDILKKWLTFYREKTTEQNYGKPLSNDELCSNLLSIKEKFATPRKTEIMDI